MHGSQLTALEANLVRGEKREGVDNVWLVNWKEVGLPYCSIYVVSADNSWPCKIGISTYAEKRVRALQTSVWRPLYVPRCYWAPTVKEAKRLEYAVHKRLTEDSRWLHGEWFDLRPDKAAEMIEFVALVEGIEISDKIEDPELAAQVHANLNFYHDPKRMMDIKDKKYGCFLD